MIGRKLLAHFPHKVGQVFGAGGDCGKVYVVLHKRDHQEFNAILTGVDAQGREVHQVIADAVKDHIPVDGSLVDVVKNFWRETPCSFRRFHSSSIIFKNRYFENNNNELSLEFPAEAAVDEGGGGGEGVLGVEVEVVPAVTKSDKSDAGD